MIHMVYVPTCTIKNIQPNVCKHTSPMDAMGIDLMINAIFDPSNGVGKAKEQLAVLQRVYDEMLGMEIFFRNWKGLNIVVLVFILV